MRERLDSIESKPKVVIVDDQEGNLLALEVLLRPVGFETVRCSSGRAALEYLSENEVALVLCDIRMPVLSGYDVLNQLRKFPSHHSTPVILVTGANQSEAEIVEAYEFGAADIIQKPIHEKILIAKARVFLELYEANRMKKELATSRHFFEGDGEMPTRFRDMNWSQTALGDVSTWPQSLRTAVGIMLKSQFPMFIAWGPRRVFLYNDAYIPVLGKKHGKALGEEFEKLWSDIWNDLLPLVDSVDQGRAVYLEDLHLVMNRNGFAEDTYFTFSYSPIRDESDQVQGLFCACVETTEKIVRSRQLATERDNLLKILESNSSPNVLWRGEELIYEKVSPAYQALTPGKQLIGLPIHEAMPEPEYEHFFEIIRGVFRTGETVTMKEQLVWFNVDGKGMKEQYYTLSFFQVKDADGQPYGVYQQAVDNTEQILIRKQLEAAKSEAERANQLKSSFLANMSHEIRTPLGAILGFSSLLKDRTLELKEKDRYVDTIIRNGTALTKIIDDILDLAKVEAGKLDIEEIPFSLYKLATDAVDLFKDKTKEKDIYLLLNIDDSVPSQICSDPTRLRQIFVNLIGNAVKFTDKGGIRVSIRAAAADGNKIKIMVDVKDTGIGVTEEQTEKLFTPFNQADNSMTRKFGGTGLGLALSQRLSHALAGEISISESRADAGSTFTLTFEAALVNHMTKGDAKIDSVDVLNTVSLDGLRVLVIDDSQDNLFLVERLLTKNGATVETARDGDEGVNKAMSGAFDVVLMDIQMPKLDGYQAKQVLDRSDYQKPIIALTAHAMSDERIKTKAAGFAGHLTKPLNGPELLNTLATFK